MFESSVNSDGTQTGVDPYMYAKSFESSVNSDGTQTDIGRVFTLTMFESSVNSDGTQTANRITRFRHCLRAV